MSLSPDSLAKIAHLARINATPAELIDVGIKLEGIFRLIDEMQNVNTKGVAPMSHGQDVVAFLRSDAVTESDEREKFQTNAPSTEQGYFLVPKVIE
jgi:aspartyl-tRNA(Asn)/glutamyl-tRNA(Gln) amidotransferase subunit C